MSQEHSGARSPIIYNPIHGSVQWPNSGSLAFSSIPNVLLQGQDWIKQCWDAETNLEFLNINSGLPEENNNVQLNAEFE